jgi:FMN phosphatase YigB (HAD superfamily)
MNEIKAIIFDYGRVIGNFDHRRTAEKLAAHSSRSAEQILEYLYPAELEDDFENGSLSTHDFLRVVRDQLRLQCPAATIRAAIADIFWPNADVCALIPQLVPRYRLILGSNTNVIHSEHFRQLSADVLKHFHGLILSHEVEVRKPAKAFFEHCVRMAEQPAGACLFVDDLEVNIAGAKEAGLQTLLYRGQPTLAAELKELGIVLSA